MEIIVNLNDQTAGRDQLARLCQYLTRIVWYKLEQHNADEAKVNWLKSLETQLSNFRRLLRFGGCIDILILMLPIFYLEDVILKTILILGNIANSIHYFADHVLWLGEANICTVDNEKMTSIYHKSRLYHIITNFFRDYYEFSAEKDANEMLDEGLNGSTDFVTILGTLLLKLQGNQPVLVDLIKNCCDIFISLNGLKYISISAGTIGMLGVISAIAALLVLTNPWLKLSP